MKKLIFIFALLILSAATFYSCEKNKLEPNLNEDDVLFVNPSEEFINGELFIDGISQKEIITDFNIEGVELIEGRLAFDDHDAMMNAIYELSAYNEESVIAWSTKIGFTSLFTELTRIEEHSVAEMEAELTRDKMYKEYFNITKEGILELSKHSIVHARIFNTKGLVQVGEYVGVHYMGLNVWVHTNNIDKLLEALENHRIPEGDNDFFVADKSAFDYTKNWVILEGCPKDSDWLGPDIQYQHPGANRRINVQNQYDIFLSYAGNGLWDLSASYWLHSTSRKSSWNKYRTDHYHSFDIRMQRMSNRSNPTATGDEIVVQRTFNINRTKTAHSFFQIAAFRGVSLSSALNVLWVRLTRTFPGTTGQTGTAASHRGMGARYGRQLCE